LCNQFGRRPKAPEGHLHRVCSAGGLLGNWIATDQDGQWLNADATAGVWHTRRIDLSQFVGKQIVDVSVLVDYGTQDGWWATYFMDMSYLAPDGTVFSLYNGQRQVTATGGWQTSAMSNVSLGVDHISSYPSPDQAITYFHPDHLGSTTMTSSGAGWPSYQCTYGPYGQAMNCSDCSPMTYKFAGMEQDDESTTDHTKFRQYAFTSGRWLSVDRLFGEIQNPQSFNRYAYVMNNPLIFNDPLGLENCHAEFDKISIDCEEAKVLEGRGFAKRTLGISGWIREKSGRLHLIQADCFASDSGGVDCPGRSTWFSKVFNPSDLAVQQKASYNMIIEMFKIPVFQTLPPPKILAMIGHRLDLPRLQLLVRSGPQIGAPTSTLPPRNPTVADVFQACSAAAALASGGFVPGGDFPSSSSIPNSPDTPSTYVAGAANKAGYAAANPNGAALGSAYAAVIGFGGTYAESVGRGMQYVK
jgi:RHS repeat-associated protein